MKTTLRYSWLIELAKLHRDKWEITGDIKLLKIAHDLTVEASFESLYATKGRG